MSSLALSSSSSSSLQDDRCSPRSSILSPHRAVVGLQQRTDWSMSCACRCSEARYDPSCSSCISHSYLQTAVPSLDNLGHSFAGICANKLRWPARRCRQLGVRLTAYKTGWDAPHAVPQYFEGQGSLQSSPWPFSGQLNMAPAYKSATLQSPAAAQSRQLKSFQCPDHWATAGKGEQVHLYLRQSLLRKLSTVSGFFESSTDIRD